MLQYPIDIGHVGSAMIDHRIAMVFRGLGYCGPIQFDQYNTCLAKCW
jgi:hypothetical protein